MTNQTKGNLIGLAFVACIAAIGAGIIYVGVGKLGRSGQDAPGWVLVIAGGAFLFADASMSINAIGGSVFGATAGRDGALSADAPYGLRVAQIVLSFAILGMLATVATWVAFNPGEHSSSGQKFAFATAAIVGWLSLIAVGVWRIRRLAR